MENAKFYTYAYLREDKTPYYIGKGTGRRAFHKYEKYEIKPPKDKNRIVILKRNLTEDEAFKHEKYIISLFGRKDIGTGILRNRTNGGDGESGRIPWNLGKSHSLQTKQKIKEKRSKQIFSLETREKMSISRKGRKISTETREKISISAIGKNKGKKRTLEQKQKLSLLFKDKPSKYKYKIISPDGKCEIIDNLPKYCRMYPELKLDNSALLKVAKGIYSNHKGFIVTFIN